MSSALRPRADSLIRVAVILAAIYTALVCAHGVPALRHDWFWPLDRYTSFNTIVTSTSGWNAVGIGSPSPYPAAYLVGPCLGIAGVVLGPFATLVLFVFAIALSITCGARALCLVLGASALQTAAVVIFALFNPWVYNQTVAGHLYMLLAYGACFAVLAELLRSNVNQRRLIVLLLLILPQLQFFLIALVAVAIHSLLRRSYLPLVTGFLVGTPIWIGLALDRSNLLGTPYTLAWETSQSVDPRSAVVLSGYFANYAVHFNAIQMSCVWVIVACACVSAVFGRPRTLVPLTVVLIAVFLIAATGTRGPLGSTYASTVLHFRESGVFRELYDLIAFVSIGYCVLLAVLPSRKELQAVTFAAVAASIVMTTAWFTWPPSSYWVGRSQLPRVSIPTLPNTRFALYPAYQPMQFGRKGSGADPDAYARPGNVTPLNEYFAQYPVDVALSAFAQTSNASGLAALSTSLVVQRPWLHIDAKALNAQLNGLPPDVSAGIQSPRYLTPLPEVTFVEYPSVAGLASVLGAGNIFFADARNVRAPFAPAAWRSFPNFEPVRVSNAFVDERKGWTDVRFAFASNPTLGQGLGGVITTNPRAWLRVRGGEGTLVNIQGTLRSQENRIVIGSTRGYGWVRLPASVTAVRCAGRCVIVGQAALTRIPVLNPAARRYVGATFAVITPWLVRVDVPANAPPVLRYNVAYDPNWVATPGTKALAHLRLDTTVNGWVLKNSNKSYVLYLLHRVSVAQTLAEIFAVLWLVAVVLYRRPLALARMNVKPRI